MTAVDPPIDAKLSAARASRYRLERELGAGGAAIVYLAEDLSHQPPRRSFHKDLSGYTQSLESQGVR